MSMKPENPYFASLRGLEVKLLGMYIHLDRVALPAVLLKVQHRPELLRVPTLG